MAQASRKVSKEGFAGASQHSFPASFPAKVLQEESNLTRASHPALALMVSSMVNMVQKGRQDDHHI